MRQTVLAGIAGLLLLAGLVPAAAAELIMFERDGCMYCARWKREVGPIYQSTPEGRSAPVRHVDLGDAGREKGLATPVRYTPTFVLMNEGREVGRITGYINDQAFWGLLGKMLAGIAPNVLPTSDAATADATVDRR